MFRIKICGVTNREDAISAFKAGADAIGLNFYSKSSRFLSIETAKEITKVVPKAVGVFVNYSSEQIKLVSEEVGISAIQLHGDEPPELISELDVFDEIIWARPLGKTGLKSIVNDIVECKKTGRAPNAVLIDAAVRGHYGGTGECVDWNRLSNHQAALHEIPLVLAGGLSPDNVANAIEHVRPYGIDVASGVEKAPGVKDHIKMREFIKKAKQAFEQIEV